MPRIKRHHLPASVIALTAFLASASGLHADCTNPVAVEGTMVYNISYKVVQFCNGTSWVNAGSSSSVGGSGAFGTLTAGNFCTTDGTVINCNVPSITNSMLAGSIDISKLSIGGTGSASTFLRGDGTWATAGGNPGGSSMRLQYNNGGAFGGAEALTYATSGNLLTAAAQAATDTPLVVKGAASQSGDLLQVQNSSGTAVAKVDASGYVHTPMVKLTGVAGTAGMGTGVVGGDSGAVQFNQAGNFAGDAALFWDNTNKRLGVGTASPLSNAKLHVETGQDKFLALESGAYGMYLSGDTTSSHIPVIGVNGGQPLTFLTNGNERVRIDGSGNVGIGTTSPAGTIDVENGGGTATICLNGVCASSVRRPTIATATSGASAGAQCTATASCSVGTVVATQCQLNSGNANLQNVINGTCVYNCTTGCTCQAWATCM